jgi:hypothetical protein
VFIYMVRVPHCRWIATDIRIQYTTRAAIIIIPSRGDPRSVSLWLLQNAVEHMNIITDTATICTN